MDLSWEYQNELQSIQSEIDIAIADVQNGFFSVLSSSTSQTLEQYQNHTIDIENLHAPIYERFQRLAEGSCRATTETLINLTRDQTGFGASNCANDYDVAVRRIINDLSIEFNNFNLQFAQLQQIVVKGFIQQNIFLTPEDASSKMKNMLDIVSKRWADVKPNLASLRASLSNRVAIQNRELTNCHNNVESFAVNMYSMVNTQLTQCENFNNSKRTFSTSNIDELHVIEEFKAYILSIPAYVWKA